MTHLIKIDDTAGMLADPMGRAWAYAAQSKSDNTRAAYGSAWRAYSEWCAGWGVDPKQSKPTDVARYLSERAEGLAASSVRVALAAIRSALSLAGNPLNTADPFLSMVVAGIQRNRGTRAQRKAAPMTLDVLLQFLSAIPDGTAAGARDRAMLVVQFGGGLRNAELVGLTIGDVTIEPKGVVLLLRKSKTDQLGKGREVSVARNPIDPGCCPVVVLERWLTHRGTTDPNAPLFCQIAKGDRVKNEGLSTRTVADNIKAAAHAAGLNPTIFSGHSARRGLITQAAQVKASLADIMTHVGHRDASTTAGYIQRANRWDDNVSAQVWNKGV